MKSESVEHHAVTAINSEFLYEQSSKMMMMIFDDAVDDDDDDDDDDTLHRGTSMWPLNLELSLFSNFDKTYFQWYSRKDVVHMDRTGIGCILLSSDISHRRISNQGHLYLFVDQIYVERSQKALEYF